MTFWVMHFSAVVPVMRSRSWQRSWFGAEPSRQSTVQHRTMRIAVPWAGRERILGARIAGSRQIDHSQHLDVFSFRFNIKHWREHYGRSVAVPRRA
jgi:hypothetical protein